MKVGIDFPDLFSEDNYVLRHITGHNMYNPESLITGAELNEGLNYRNSTRDYKDFAQYLKIVTGDISANDVSTLAPRVLK